MQMLPLLAATSRQRVNPCATLGLTRDGLNLPLGGLTRTGAIVPPDSRSLAQAPPRIISFCVCARVLFVYKPSVNMALRRCE